jgi:glycerol-3-phosphate dehydrogenase subunit C
MLGPGYERFRLLKSFVDESISYCSNCKNCDIACPNGVPISALNLLAAKKYYEEKAPPLRNWFVSHGEFIYNFAGLFPAALANFGMNNYVTRRLLDMLGLHKSAPLPPFAPSSFKSLFSKLKQPENLKKEVVFFPGCYIKLYEPSIGIDLVRLLNISGYRVTVPKEFVCCGLPMISNGYFSDTRRNALINHSEFEKWTNVPVLTACPSCALMLNQEYGDLFPDIFPKPFSNIIDACEFLLEIITNSELKADYSKNISACIYHAPCHLRAQGIGRTGYDMLRLVPSLRVTGADAGCCGISGSYGFKKEKYKISLAVGSELFDTIKRSDPDMVLTECGTCQVQIRHATGKKVIHPVSALANAVGI